MMRIITLTAAAVLLAATTAPAHVFPKKAKQIKSDLVQHYEACTAPDTATVSANVPACGETEAANPDCTFSSDGTGQFQAKISKTGGYDVKSKVQKLDANCEGKTLTAAFDVRTTTDDCPNEHCTVIDQELTVGSCVVTKGKCQIKASLPSGYPSGAGSESTILGCGINDGALRTFSCGIMVP